MKRFVLAFALTLAAPLCAARAADLSGSWRLDGKVATFAFTLACVFKQDASRLGGACTDASTNDPKLTTGKSHPLTAGRVDGDHVSFTYQSHFLLSTFDVTYAGVQTGDRLQGEVRVPGRRGAFTAVRQ